mmetsp:Transcript_257/g.475  ORF Transcript_257/g.475 Transcript_257/m.475 type:complete len:262 (-) Transcript_257:1167-1952(-)
MEKTTLLTWVLIGFGVFTQVALSFIKVPHGKTAKGHFLSGFGPSLPSSTAWIIMESPVVFWCVFYIIYACVLNGNVFYRLGNVVQLLFLFVHYVNRSFIFSRKLVHANHVPFITYFLAFIFCMINGYLQSYYLMVESEPIPFKLDLKFLLGAGLFLLGFSINVKCDHMLINIRQKKKAEEQKYVIPHGFLFEYVTCPNYFGEVVEWIGWTMLCGFSIPSLAFAFYSFSYLTFRSNQQYQWYIERFPTFSKLNRKRIYPYLY